MHIIREKKSVNWGFILVGILFIVAGVLAFLNPVGNLEALAFAFGFLAIINGIWSIAGRMGSSLRLVIGIIDIIIGVLLLTNIYATMVALPYVFAIWFIADSIFRIIMAGSLKIFGTGYYAMSLIFNIIGVIVGILLLVNPVTAALTLTFLVGFYLTLAGIECLALAFAG